MLLTDLVSFTAFKNGGFLAQLHHKQEKFPLKWIYIKTVPTL